MNVGSKHETSEYLRNPKEKRRKPGIIYLSSVPPSMNVSKLREYFTKFGQLGRVYLQPMQEKSSKKSKRMQFSEGWLEFKSKRKAKYAHSFLNNEPVGGKKSNPDYDILWNIKYLPRFKWEFLNQRLEYERQLFRKRMGAEISQVNRETDHYLRTSMVGDKIRKDREKEDKIGYVFRQKRTEEEIKNKKEAKRKKDEKFRKLIERRKKLKQKLKVNESDNDDLLSSVFVGSNK